MKLLREYIRLLLEQDEAPKVIFTAGGPGSGKSTVIRQLGLSNRLDVINPDDQYEESLRAENLPLDRTEVMDQYKPIKVEYLAAQEAGDAVTIAELEPEYLRLRNILSRNMKLFTQARKAAKSRGQEHAGAGEEFLVDGTGGNYNEIANQVEKLRSVGYEVAMIYIDVPLESSIDRNIKRGQEKCSDPNYVDRDSCEAAGETWLPGGRRLRDSEVERSWKAVNRNKGQYESLFGDNFFYIDASGNREQFREEIDAIAAGVMGFLG